MASSLFLVIFALPKIHLNLNTNFANKVFTSIGNEVLRATVAQYDSDQLLKQRNKISQEIKDGLIVRAADFNVILDDVSITHLSFSKQYTDAIERKQVAQQEAEKSKFVVEQHYQEKLATIMRSEGEAEGAALISNAVNIHGNGKTIFCILMTVRIFPRNSLD